MSKDDLNQSEEEQSTLGFESKSEDSNELDELFADDSQDEEGEDKVTRLERKIENIQKGVNKYFSEQGRKQKEVVKQPEKKEEGQPTPQVNPVLKTLYFDKFPETKEVWAEVEKEAKLLNKDPFELYESSSYFKGEAKARFNAKTEEEANKSKIDKPANGAAPSKVDINNTKPEDVKNLKPEQKVEWLRAQAKKERESTE